MTKLAVIGPGLLGGSLALAARRRGGFHVSAWARRSEAVEELQTRGFADHASSDLRAVTSDADLIVLCVPVGAMPALARELAQWIPERALVTDVGSVKKVRGRGVERHFPKAWTLCEQPSDGGFGAGWNLRGEG